MRAKKLCQVAQDMEVVISKKSHSLKSQELVKSEWNIRTIILFCIVIRRQTKLNWLEDFTT